MQTSTVQLSNNPPTSASFSGVTSNSCSLFDIRLERDFLVFWGSQYESSDQLLKGVVVLCLRSPLKLEDIRLRLDGTVRHAWLTDPGVAHNTNILKHKWPALIGTNGKSLTLAAGNYEWPFELMMAGDTAESLEGIRDASIIYSLRATIGRGKLARHISCSKQVRVIRTFAPTALEFMHSEFIEQTWVNKVDYSVSIPTKAAVFGGTVALEMRFTPLVKGIQLGHIAITLLEFHEFSMHSRHYIYTREQKGQRQVSSWDFDISEQDWQDNIEEINQEGWVIKKTLQLPRKLGECVQDIDAQGIRIYHKLKVHIPIRNQDGHMSHLDMGIPVNIFISPFMALDEHGNLVARCPDAQYQANESTGPPLYGAHILDQLYDNVESWQMPANGSPPTLPEGDSSYVSPRHLNENNSRSSSETISTDPEDLFELSKVPTYRTALRTPLQSHGQQDGTLPPEYRTTAANQS
ncbi:dinitrobenzene,calcium zinc resistance protein [Fusarium heterosporum]|uniref:Dinitrobenzene,calcium zinc resistance protein n=1 Tax=Fusarium heterosporum TaxID=42747 RepID=A0A8H5TCA5_FUSHE|nr:dinitrobenzene,calcium zinc resistance protein [Fusarium heterosporum]